MRVRQHVNPLKSDFFTIAPERVVVPAGAALEVELGSGEAWFLRDRAREDPGGFYVGVEIRRDLADKANKECALEGLDRVQSVFANMSVDLPRLFGERSVRRFFLNFPDPYFKRQQHKRRVLGPTLIDDLARLLVVAGEIHVNTDIFEHALDAMFLLESDPAQRFENLRAPWSFLERSRFAARSRRDHQCAREGTRVWRLAYGLAPEQRVGRRVGR
jgi:tRNA (guanine-N7-)-methyltransferase